MKPTTSPQSSARVQRYFLIGGVIVGLVLISVLFGSAVRQESLIMAEVRAAAEALFENIVTTRRWNADHGGVFVLKGPGVESNPYLEDPDIHTVEGEVYTKKNPALMTREVSEYASDAGRYTFHITSLNLLNPDNAPDAWETQALQAFESGATVVTEVAKKGDEEVFRLMRPLYYEESCAACHASQGYVEGDVRGGISVNIPFTGTRNALNDNRLAMALLGVLVIGILAFVLYYFVWRMMNRVARQNRDLAELNTLKTKFMGMAAHDLGNPIAVVQGYLRIMASEQVNLSNTPERRARILSKMDSACDRMLALVHDLVDLNAIDAGGVELHPYPLDLGPYLVSYVDMSRVLADDKSVELVLDAPSTLPTVPADEPRLEQVLNNLLSNALKYTEAGTRVTLRVRESDDGREVVIAIIDQGRGIPPDEMSQLFVEFGKTSTRPVGGGRSTGLGLAITKRLVEAHGGRVWAESVQGVGSTFYLSLPVQRQA